jgi:adiponectin receptor
MDDIVDSAKDVAQEVEKKALEAEKEIEHKITYLWNEIAPWQQDNQYITSGYRPQSNSYAKSWKSLLYIHNETVNIYTHLVGAAIFFFASYFLYNELEPRYETASKEDVYVFSCFFAGAVACLGMSGTYHTIQNHSHEVAVWGNKLDYLGIVFLIWGSFIPVLYYAFDQEPGLMKTYWTMVGRCCTLHSYDLLLTSMTDHHSCGGNERCLCAPSIPHSGASSFTCAHVRAHGAFRRLPSSSRYQTVWC